MVIHNRDAASPTRHRQPQRGASLLVVLIFMLVLSVLATFGVRNVRLLERQAVSEQEYQLARQAAEAAMADALIDIEGSDPDTSCVRGQGNEIMTGTNPNAANSSAFTTDCARGLCKTDTVDPYFANWTDATPAGAPWWPNSKGGQWGNNATNTGAPSFNCSTGKGGVPLGTYTNTAPFPGVARQPEYLLELLGTPNLMNGELVYKMDCPNPGGGITSGGKVILNAANETQSGGSSSAVGVSCYLFRITARGFGRIRTNADSAIPNPRSEVVLQGYVHRNVK